MNKRILLTLVLGCTIASAFSQPRNAEAMKMAAGEVLAAHFGVSAETATLTEWRTLSHCAMLGQRGDNHFVVVSTDGQQVLGYGTRQQGATENPNFEWWLQAIDEALAAQPRRALNTGRVRPNPKKYPVAVEPLLTTNWGQMDPYNRKCFYDTLKQERTAVGCVATSMAQVLNYYKLPEHGEGTRTVYYPYQDSINGQSITVDFADVTYRWDLFEGMTNFAAQPFTDEQADAISTLLLHLGVAANMQYGIGAEGGSGTTAAAAAEGLRNYLFQPTAQVVFRNSYSDEDWMDMVFGEIGTDHPLIYGGAAFSGGHSFVLNGYDRDGLVYVNWGWNGDSNGYYNINLLNPGGTSFADMQDMIIGINPTVYAPLVAQVTLAEAGTMAQQLSSTQLTEGCTLQVSGPMNEADFEALRTTVAGQRIAVLDLSGAEITALPERALYGCHELKTLSLPATLKHIGDGALADLRYLENIALQPADDADFVVDGRIVYNKEMTEIICALSTISGELVVPATVTAIHPYAFAGCVLLERVELPATITALGAETFRNCYWLEELKVRSKKVIDLQGYDVFDGIDMSVCRLLVPSGLRTTYKRRAQWMNFNEIVEYGTTVKATSTVRKQGEPNPEFGYSITGDPVTGTPYLYTDAEIDSPPGRYTIFATAGTITEPDVEYVNGILIVEATDGIEAPAASQQSRALYDLQGRPATTGSTKKGIFVERTADGRIVKRNNK